MSGRGWIFITSTQDTRDALKPLHAAFINILMKRLLSVDRNWGRTNPCWFVIDEVHALKYLPALPTFMVECCKYRVKTILGTQGKHQMSPTISVKRSVQPEILPGRTSHASEKV